MLADVIAWSMLAVVVAVVGRDGRRGTVLLVIPYVVILVVAVRPLLRWPLARQDKISPTMLAMAGAGLLAATAVTEWMGPHFIFGAFLFGLIVPREGTKQLPAQVSSQVAASNTTLFLPPFF